MQKILVAGATGYLGKFIVEDLLHRHFNTSVVVRDAEKFDAFNLVVNRVIQASITDKTSLSGCCKGIDVVISALGITKQRDGLSYLDVDYQANLNLLDEAKKSGVKKFIYISVLNGEELAELQICHAKEKFVNALKDSGLEFCVIRPNGFFSDMKEFFNMAVNGRIYLFGNGELRSNPIHGEDLATVCVDAIASTQTVITIGGPQTLTQNEIARLAFEAAKQPVKITYIPDWLRSTALKVLRLILPSRTFGPIEFFMTVMAREMTAPEYGRHTLKEYFNTCRQIK